MFEPEKYIQKQVQEVRERIGAGKAMYHLLFSSFLSTDSFNIESQVINQDVNIRGDG